jgi:thiamine-monophosphate kinase
MRFTESGIIDYVRRRAKHGLPAGVKLGIGDDCAVLRRLPAAEELLLTTDQVIENTHFVRSLHPPKALGHKCLARGLSDIAAMGGTPFACLLSLGLPRWARNDWLKRFFDGMFQLARSSRSPLVGGDTARSALFSAHVTVLGSAPRGKALRRDTAEAGDLLYVSGRLGGSLLGFERLKQQGGASRDLAVRRHLMPSPRLELGRYLRDKLRASAAIDLSDGLSTDLARLARASGVAAEIQADAVPRFPGASLRHALESGEEYELLFTVPAGVRVPARWRNLPLSPIGRIRRGRGTFLISEQSRRPLEPKGFEHFDSAP